MGVAAAIVLLPLAVLACSDSDVPESPSPGGTLSPTGTVMAPNGTNMGATPLNAGTTAP